GAVHHFSDVPQWMRRRNSGLHIHIGEKRTRPLVTPPHRSALPCLLSPIRNHILTQYANSFFNSLLVVIDKARESCGAASEVAATVADQGFALLRCPIRRVTTPNVPMPYSPPLERELLPTEERLVGIVRGLMSWSR